MIALHKVEMFRIASREGIIAKFTAWRCLQDTVRGPKLSTNAYVRFYSSLLSPGITSNKSFLSLKPITCRLSRLCHRVASGGNADQDDKKGFSLKVLFQGPKPALYLGLTGLTPFLSAPLLMVATNTFYPQVAYAQIVYGASIVSFLGGARWGFAIPEGSPVMPDWKNLGNSVLPSLLAWMALLCKDNITEGALIVIMGLGLSLHYDLTLLSGYPAWFKALRTILTLVATFSLVATLTLKKYMQ